jgi:hypothetical protein
MLLNGLLRVWCGGVGQGSNAGPTWLVGFEKSCNGANGRDYDTRVWVCVWYGAGL